MARLPSHRAGNGRSRARIRKATHNGLMAGASGLSPAGAAQRPKCLASHRCSLVARICGTEHR
jgi:hypothetical protein